MNKKFVYKNKIHKKSIIESCIMPARYIEEMASPLPSAKGPSSVKSSGYCPNTLPPFTDPPVVKPKRRKITKVRQNTSIPIHFKKIPT
jgi:hypothetical protein